MLFNSIEFAVFFFVVYGLYLVLPLRRQNLLLLAAGYVFYGSWDVRFLFLLVFSTTVDFWIGCLLGHGRVQTRQRWLASVVLPAAAVLCLALNWAELARLLLGRGGAEQALWSVAELPAQAGIALALLAVLGANLSHDAMVRLAPERRRVVLVWATVLVNLGFLATFKYFNFFIDSIALALAGSGMDVDRLHLNVILPVGISFYTFQSLSYTLDVSKGLIQPVQRFRDFALYVAYFPPMVAGPIERARHLLPQLMTPRRITPEHVRAGLFLIAFGFFKKVAIADGLAPSVGAVYGSPGGVAGAADIALATLLFAFQIYCDFSGYTDIARGVSKLLGIDLILNFKLPYFSQNPSEFWRRWHISLSSWLRDYLYIALGGNRKGERRTYVNLMLTMALGGLWHGASWNFMLWGVYQGLLLCVHRGHQSLRARLWGAPADAATAGHPGWSLLRAGFFFFFVCYGWLLFRAQSVAQIADFTQALLHGRSAATLMPTPPLSALLGLGLLGLIDGHALAVERGCARPALPQPVIGFTVAAVLLVTAMGMSNVAAEFIYFQF